MTTRVLQVSARTPEPEIIEEAAAVIRAGGRVAFPTETVYGLGADGLNEAAVRRIFAAKGRPEAKGLILHLSAPAQVREVAQVSPMAERLMEAFFPGPLALVLPALPVVPAVKTGRWATVTARVPAHSGAQAPIPSTSRDHRGYHRSRRQPLWSWTCLPFSLGDTFFDFFVNSVSMWLTSTREVVSLVGHRLPQFDLLLLDQPPDVADFRERQPLVG